MDAFISYIISSLTSAASTSNSVFPPPSCVLLLFSERLGSEIISTYVSGLVARAREVDAEIVNSKDGNNTDKSPPGADEWTTLGSEQGQERYLQAMAASFIMCWKVVDTLIDTSDGTVKREEAELIVYVPISAAEISTKFDISYRIFDSHMDEYLDEEVEAVKRSFDNICQEWDKRVRRVSYLRIIRPLTKNSRRIKSTILIIKLHVHASSLLRILNKSSATL